MNPAEQEDPFIATAQAWVGVEERFEKEFSLLCHMGYYKILEMKYLDEESILYLIEWKFYSYTPTEDYDPKDSAKEELPKYMWVEEWVDI